MQPDPLVVCIRANECVMQLCLPIFFDVATLAKIRKVFELMNIAPWRNEEARECLRRFFVEWTQDHKDRLAAAETDLFTAKQDAEMKRRRMESMGSYLDTSIDNARRRLDNTRRYKASRKQGTKELKQQAVEALAAELAFAAKPKTDYEHAAKKVKQFENAVKKAKAVVARCDKILNSYNNTIIEE